MPPLVPPSGYSPSGRIEYDSFQRERLGTQTCCANLSPFWAHNQDHLSKQGLRCQGFSCSFHSSRSCQCGLVGGYAGGGCHVGGAEAFPKTFSAHSSMVYLKALPYSILVLSGGWRGNRTHRCLVGPQGYSLLDTSIGPGHPWREMKDSNPLQVVWNHLCCH